MATLDDLRRRIRVRAVYAVATAAPDLQRELRGTSPRVTGQLESKTSVTADGLVATARAATEYASFVRSGTRPHVIRPKRGKLLSFYWPVTSRQMFLPKVNHPGTQGNTWWDRALSGWHRLVEDGLKRAPN